MNISLIDKTLKPIASLNNATSVVWTTKLWEHSSVAVQLDPSISAFPKDAWGIMRDDADEIMRITSVKYNDDTTEIEAVALTQLFERRTILAVQSFTNADMAVIIRSLINNAMATSTKMPGVIRSFTCLDTMPEQPSTGTVISYTSDFGEVFDAIKNIIGSLPIRFFISGRIPSLYNGVDLANKIVFSEEAGDLSGYEFNRNCLDYANMAVVCGSGEGSARIVALVDQRSAGEELLELYVEDSSESTSNLVKKGNEELSKLPVVLALETSVASSRNMFRRDFNLGDRVGYVTSQASGTDIVSEVEETFENGGGQIKISLGKTAPTVKEYIQNKTR